MSKQTEPEKDFQQQVDDAAGPYATLSHAERIKAERTLMQVGHVSRSKVRASLQKSTDAFQKQQAGLPPPVAPVIPRPETPLLTATAVTTFAPRPFTLGAQDRPNIGGDIAPPDAGTPIKFHAGVQVIVSGVPSFTVQIVTVSGTAVDDDGEET